MEAHLLSQHTISTRFHESNAANLSNLLTEGTGLCLVRCSVGLCLKQRTCDIHTL